MTFSFIHAADLHLGSPFLGLSEANSDLAQRVSLASREAMSDLVSKAIELRVNFLVIAGDVYDGDWKDTTIGHFFNRQMARLGRESIPVYLIRGNHDAESVVTRAITLPETVHTFSSQTVETFKIPELKVVLHGRSFPNRAVPENLSVTYPEAEANSFNIGVLHTSCNGRQGHARYAPCTVQDLLQRGYQYWALGHVHSYEEVNKQPPIIYPGNLQGRNIRECGAKGAVVVRVEDGDVAKVSRLLVERVRWASISADLTNVCTENAAFAIIREAIQREVDDAGETPLIYRMILTGVTPLNHMLRADLERIRDEVMSAADHCSELIWRESLKLNTEDPVCSNAIENSPLAALDFGATLTSLLASPEVLREAREALESIRGRFPPMPLPVDLFGNEGIPPLFTLLDEARKALLRTEMKAAL